MTYTTSMESMKKRQKNMNLLSLLMPIGMALFMYLAIIVNRIETEDYLFFIKLAIGLSIFLVIEMQIVSRVMINKIKNLSITFDETGFDRLSGKSNERFEFADFESAKAVYDYKGKELLQIKFKSKKKAIMLGGLDNMEDIFEHIKNAGVTTSEKKMKADWDSPILVIGVFFGTLALLGLILVLKSGIFENVIQLFQLGLGIWFIAYKPVSRSSGKKFRVLEYILGGLIIVCASVVLGINLFG